MISGDASVKSFVFDGGSLEFIYRDNESDTNYCFKVKTPIVYSEALGGDGCVHYRVVSLDGALPVHSESGLYVFPQKFSDQMSLVKKGYHIFIGLKAIEYPYAFTLIGNGKIAVCPIKNEQDVVVGSTSSEFVV